MSDKLVSIIIPCYNQAHLLRKSIDSCLGQTYSPVEIIVVDDGSPDDVQEALSGYDQRVMLVRQRNKGLSRARNTGLERAKGKYVKFLDADDWLLPDCLKAQVASICRLPNYISFIGFRLCFDGENRPDEDRFPKFGKLSHQLSFVNLGPPHAFLFHTNSVRSANGFDCSDRVVGGHEDYDLLCRLSVLGYETVALHTIGVVYRQTSDSMSKNMFAMSKSRAMVWTHYAREMLKSECLGVGDAVSLLGGYALRLSTGDIRYERQAILNDLVHSLSRDAQEIPYSEAIELCKHIADIRKNTPMPHGEEEAEMLQDLRKTLSRFERHIAPAISKGPVFTMETGNALINLAKSHIWINRSEEYRGFFLRVQSIKISPWIIKLWMRCIDALISLRERFRRFFT